MTLIHMASPSCSFILPLTSAIIGPRTTKHLGSQIGAADSDLADEILNRIDSIVGLGTNFLWAVAGYTFPGISNTSRRRRASPICCWRAP